MLCLLNTEDFDNNFFDRVKEAEKRIFVTDKLIRGNKLTVCARVLLGYMLKINYGIYSFSYSYGENGKPYLDNKQIYFNISHSGNYVLCCLSESEVGCDIEKIKDYNPKVAKRFFTKKEADLLENEDTEDIYFAKLWTLKESILKKEGTGIGGGLDTFCFADYIGDDFFTAYGCNFICYNFGEYMISVCSENIEKEITEISKKEITEYINSL